ncbi:NADH-quinone oxidoreductase subunit H, partial [Aestuariivirga sp.]|uniref:complex I subunit 1/NuoH family protein n=1 Tax=Aestuariivirga sp. TaxID=2650926 RepID=UPI0035B34A43
MMAGLAMVLLASALLIAALLVAAGVFTWAERRVLGFFQERLGPNRVGPFGFFQWIADTVKLISKEDAAPHGADVPAYRLAPLLAAAPVLAGFGVVAFGRDLTVSTLDVGVIFVIGMLALTVWAMVLGAWASRNRYSILGGLRAAAQMLAYESFLGLSLMGVVLLSGSFSLGEIVAAQKG